MATSNDSTVYVGGYSSTAASNIPPDNGTTGKRYQGAAELRQLKKVLKDTFSAVTGAVSATHDELNILDGVTATTAELNILDGVTATTAELNILDGVTATTAEINILDGVTATAAELNILDGVTATTAELNILDGVTATAAEINQLSGEVILSTSQTASTGTVSASANTRYLCNSTSAGVTVNLPVGTAGNKVQVVDYAGTAATNNITVSPNGAEKILGAAESLLIDRDHATVTLEYIDSTVGWILV